MASASTQLYTENFVEAVQRLDANDITALFLLNTKTGVKIGDNGATSISNSLIKNTSLTDLNLHYNSIGDKGATSISNSLITNTSLTDLHLHYNSIFYF